MKRKGAYFCRKERIDRKVGMVQFYALCALCVLCGFISPLVAVQVADLSRDGVGLVVDAEPETVDLARDFYVTVTLTTPPGVTASLPDLRDRFRGFKVAEDFVEEPVTDKDGRTTSVTRWRLEPNPLAEGDERRRYRLAPFVVTVGDGTFATAPVFFAPPSAREAVSGDIEIDPSRDLPPFSWKLVGICAAAVAVALAVLAVAYLIFRKIRTAVRVYRMSPVERAFYELDKLLRKDLPARGLYKDFYVELTMVVRRYIGRQHGVRAPNLTTEEFFDATRNTPSFPQSTLDLLIDFLRRADMVKFAGVESTTEMADGAIRSARSYLSKDHEITTRKRLAARKHPYLRRNH